MSWACDLVGGELSKLSNEMVRRTLFDGKERGVYIVRHEGEIKRTPIQRGANDSITVMPPSDGSLFGGVLGEPLGIIHTHPDGKFDKLFSYQDFESLVNSDLKFSAVAYRGTFWNKASVFTRPNREEANEIVRRESNRDYGGCQACRRLNIVRTLNKEFKDCTVRVS